MVFDLPFVISIVVLICATSAAVSDFRRLEVPNWVVVLMLGLFILHFMSDSEADHRVRVLSSVAVFIVFFIIYSIGQCGGGDVKFCAAAILFVDQSMHSSFLLAFAVSAVIALGLQIAGKYLLRGTTWEGAEGWAAFRSNAGFPLAVPVALALAIVLVHQLGISSWRSASADAVLDQPLFATPLHLMKGRRSHDV